VVTLGFDRHLLGLDGGTDKTCDRRAARLNPGTATLLRVGSTTEAVAILW
jgi:hypothetical protein